MVGPRGLELAEIWGVRPQTECFPIRLFENGGFPRPCDSQVGGGMTIVQISLKFMYSENGNE